jgi:hypothetical protein
MLNAALVDEVPAPIEDAKYAWRTNDDGSVLMLRATALGLGQIAGSEAAGARASAKEPAVGAAVDAAEAGGIGGERMMPAVVTTAEVSLANAVRQVEANPAQAPDAEHINFEGTGRPGDLRRAAQALLDAWDNRDEGLEDLLGAVAALRATLAARASALQPIDRVSPRPDTKQAQVLTMLAP